MTFSAANGRFLYITSTGGRCLLEACGRNTDRIYNPTVVSIHSALLKIASFLFLQEKVLQQCNVQ